MAPIDPFCGVLRTLEAWTEPPVPRAAGWSAAQVLEHCAQSLDCSRTGFPRLKPTLVRRTIGRWVLRRFLARGAMTHDLQAQVPGLPAPAERPWPEAVARLRTAVTALAEHDGPLAEHLVFGRMSKDEYLRYHAIHIANHFEALGAG